MCNIFNKSSFVILSIFLLTLTINKTNLIDIDGLYPIIYSLWYYILSNVFIYSSFAVGDILYILFPIILVAYFYRFNRRRDRFYFLIKVPIIIYCIFYWSWGFNYQKKSDFKNLKNNYSLKDLLLTTEHYISETNNLQIEISGLKERKVESNFSFDQIKNECVKSITNTNWVTKNKKLTYFPVKKSLFSTPLSYMGFSGYINPFTLEANINYNIPKISMPLTISHEIAHQIGYAFEDEANFIAIKTLVNSNNNFLKYSGNLMALQYLLAETKKYDIEKYNRFVKNLNKGVKKNIKEKNDYYLKYQNRFEDFFKNNYDTFLKANNQKEGIKSYSLVVNLLINNHQSKI